MTATPTIVCFRLKDAAEYRFYNRLGQRALFVSKGQVLKTTSPEDIAYFRSRPDVMVECLDDGTSLEDAARIGHLEPGKTKTFQVYGRQSKAEPKTPPKSVVVEEVVPPRSETSRTQVVNATGQKVMQVGRNPQPVAQPRGVDLESEGLSPIEEATTDGKTKIVAPAKDPSKSSRRK